MIAILYYFQENINDIYEFDWLQMIQINKLNVYFLNLT